MTAARMLADRFCGRRPAAGAARFRFRRDHHQRHARRTIPAAISYADAPRVIDLGLYHGDIDGLPAEPNNSRISDERLRQAGMTQDAIDFLSDSAGRTERDDVAAAGRLCRSQTQQHGIGKVIPEQQQISRTPIRCLPPATDCRTTGAGSRRVDDAGAFEEMKKQNSSQRYSEVWELCVLATMPQTSKFCRRTQMCSMDPLRVCQKRNPEGVLNLLDVEDARVTFSVTVSA